ncbi:Pro-kumamolisin [Xylariaceae sp. FL0662B]|nr:Pro-kumamolisin [Xylariaceae sp. FL0662B]
MFPPRILAALSFSFIGYTKLSSGELHPRVTESIHAPSKWRQLGPAEEDTVIHLQIGLRHSGLDELERRVYEVSSPSHSRYGHHLSREDLVDFIKPTPEALQATRDWLYDNGIFHFNSSGGGDWITTSISVRQAEVLLGSQYHVYMNIEDGDILVRTLEWSLPAHLHEHIDVVQPTNSFFRTVPQDRYGGIPPPDWEEDGRIPTYEELVEEDLIERGHLDIPALEDLPTNPTVKDACNRLAISPLCLRVLYGTLDYKLQSNHSNKIGLVNFLGNNNNRSDIARFLELYRPDAAQDGAAESFETILIAGAQDQQTPNTPEQMERNMGLEGALDVETLIGMAHPVPVVAWNVGGEPPFIPSRAKVKNTNEPYMEWLNHILAQDDLPQVISVSYADEEQTVPESYAKRICSAFAQLGARGVSVIVAAGDDGVGPDGKCYSNDDHRRDIPKFMPTFPASCPFVTAVGGTRHLDPVMAAFDARGGFVTGGGFSNYFDRPKYQESAVRPYVEGLNTTYEGLYNPRGRGIPDVSAMAYHFPVVWNGTAHLLDGTSASAPAFAGIIAMINDALLAEGRPPMGFLNPWLYSSALSGLRDVTYGSNRGCDTLGFEAVKGWDAATGLGTPWFPALKDLALRNAFRWQHPWYMMD